MSGDHETHEHTLVMPFVVVASKGGPYDDDAFVAGWQCATVQEALRHSGASWAGTVPAAILPQLDLIAMDRGLALISEPAGEYWAFATIAPLVTPEDGNPS